MPKLQRLTARDAIKMIEESGFVFSRQTGSHAQYYKNSLRITIPIHGSKILHPKIVKQIVSAIALSD